MDLLTLTIYSEKCIQYKDIENIISRPCRKTMNDENEAG
jgi:hypothetical protein